MAATDHREDLDRRPERLAGLVRVAADERSTIVVGGRRRDWELDNVRLSVDVTTPERRPPPVPTYRPNPDLTDVEREALEA